MSITNLIRNFIKLATIYTQNVMELSRLINFYKHVDRELVKEYDLAYRNVLWYLLDLTEIKRINSRESLKEFLVRYFLILDGDINKIALNFIDKGIILEVVVNDNKNVHFSLDDIKNFMGIEICKDKYTISNSMEYFIQNYKLKLPKKTNGNRSISLKFKSSLHNLCEEELKTAILFVDFIMSRIPDEMFKTYIVKFPTTTNLYKERL